MKVVIIGAGAMGCLYGAYLSSSHEVILLDSYLPQVDAINEKGITVEEADGTCHVYTNVKAYPSGQCPEKADLVIVFVKGAYTDDALTANKDLFGEKTLVMTLQNGAGNDRKLEKYVDKKNIIIGTSKHNSINAGGGKIRHTGIGTTNIGSTVNSQENLSTVKAVLESGSFETEISENIQRIIWSKLFVNLSVNTFCAITGGTIGAMGDTPHAWAYAEKLICEAVDVANAEGMNFSYYEVLQAVHHVAETMPTGIASMSQDVRGHRKTEIDAINGTIVERGRLHNVPTPYNALVVDILHSIEDAYKFHE